MYQNDQVSVLFKFTSPSLTVADYLGRRAQDLGDCHLRGGRLPLLLFDFVLFFDLFILGIVMKSLQHAWSQPCPSEQWAHSRYFARSRYFGEGQEAMAFDIKPCLFYIKSPEWIKTINRINKSPQTYLGLIQCSHREGDMPDWEQQIGLGVKPHPLPLQGVGFMSKNKKGYILLCLVNSNL